MSSNIDTPKQLSEYLQAQLEVKKWSARALAMYAGVSHSTINRILRGESTPDPASLRSIAHTLGIDEEYLLRLAGHLETPSSYHRDPSVERLAQRLNQLPSESRQLIIRAFGDVIDAVMQAAESRDATQRELERLRARVVQLESALSVYEVDEGAAHSPEKDRIRARIEEVEEEGDRWAGKKRKL